MNLGLFALCALCTFIIIFLVALISAAETAITSITEVTIHKLKSEGNKNALLLEKIKSQKEMFIGALLLAANILDGGLIAGATSVTIYAMKNSTWVPFVTGTLTIMIVLFGDVIPKTYALARIDKVALKLAKFTYVIINILYPIIKLIEMLAQYIFKIFKIKIEDDQASFSGTEMLRGAIDLGHSRGYVLKYDKQMLDGILNLSESSVEDVMTHRKKIISIDLGQKIPDLIHQVLNSGHTRFPVWEKSPENIIGIMHIKDLFKLLKNKKESSITKKDIKNILLKPWFIPDTTPLTDQLRYFRKKRQHFALVVDEYGTMIGIVTLEDIIEDIVGQIDDEHDDSSDKMIEKKSEDCYIVRGVLSIREFNRRVDWNLSDENATTIAGLLIHEAEEIPEVGQKFNFFGIEFAILKKKDNQITRLMLTKIAEETQS